MWRVSAYLVLFDPRERTVEASEAIVAVAERLEVPHRRDETGQRLVAQGARLEAVAERAVGRRADAVGGQRRGQLLANRRDP